MQEQLTDGRRKITHIAEVCAVENDEIILRDIFSYEIKGVKEDTKDVVGEWKSCGIVPHFYPRFKLRGIELSKEVFGVKE